MADHFLGPRALADPTTDITDVYVFPSPERPGHLVLVLNLFPVAPATALFSDALTYRFRLRPMTARTDGGAPAFAPGTDDYRFDVTFDAPIRGDRRAPGSAPYARPSAVCTGAVSSADAVLPQVEHRVQHPLQAPLSPSRARPPHLSGRCK